MPPIRRQLPQIPNKSFCIEHHNRQTELVTIMDSFNQIMQLVHHGVPDPNSPTTIALVHMLETQLNKVLDLQQDITWEVPMEEQLVKQQENMLKNMQEITCSVICLLIKALLERILLQVLVRKLVVMQCMHILGSFNG